MAPSYSILQKPMPKLPKDNQSIEDIKFVEEHGYILFPSLLGPQLVQDALAEIDRMTAPDALSGRNPFEGTNTNRIYSLLNKTRVFDPFTIIPRILALNDYFLDDGYQITSFHTIQINPREKEQELHHDDAFCHFPRPRGPLGTAIMVAVDEFTAENGATSMIPGSHTWDAHRKPNESEARPMVCPPGSVLYFLGTTWHGAGANKSRKPRRSLTVQYCQPYIRPIENQILAVDPRRLGQIDRRIVEMMGYKIHRPFIGYGELSLHHLFLTRMLDGRKSLVAVGGGRSVKGDKDDIERCLRMIADGLNPIRGARRMVEWLSKPMIENPPAFPDHGTGRPKDSKL